MSSTPALKPDDDAARVLPELSRVVVPTDRDDGELAKVREAAAHLATEHGWEIVLYDRSHETWMDHPHPRGPVTADELDGDEWEHLRTQLRDLEAAGVTATAWLATVPSITAMIDVMQELEIDGVLMPENLERPKLADRLLGRGDAAETVEQTAELQLDDRAPTFLEVCPDGRVTLADHTA